MDKSASRVTADEFSQYIDAIGAENGSTDRYYQEYLDDRDRLNDVGDVVMPSFGALAGWRLGNHPIIGAGTGMLLGQLVKRFDKSRRDDHIRRTALAGKKKNGKDDDGKDKEKSEKSEKKGSAMTDVDNAYIKSFMQRCHDRGIKENAAVKMAEAVIGARSRIAEEEKRAAYEFDRLSPYQQGFVRRCRERGVPFRKVAEFCSRAKKK